MPSFDGVNSAITAPCGSAITAILPTSGTVSTWSTLPPSLVTVAIDSSTLATWMLACQYGPAPIALACSGSWDTPPSGPWPLTHIVYASPQVWVVQPATSV